MRSKSVEAWRRPTELRIYIGRRMASTLQVSKLFQFEMNLFSGQPGVFAEGAPADFNYFLPVTEENVGVQIAFAQLERIVRQDCLRHVMLNHVLKVEPLILNRQLKKYAKEFLLTVSAFG